MVLQPADWYQYGQLMGDIDKKIKKMYVIITNKYGYSGKESIIVSRLLYYRDQIQCNLDSEVCKAYLMNTEYLPGYGELRLINVFYSLNRYTCDEFNSMVKKYRPLPKTLSQEEKNEFLNNIISIHNGIDQIKIDIFRNSNEHITRLKTALNDLEKFINTAIIV